ncbi:hypothetical protein [Aquimarina sp. RZ0]|uniref:hypothetical protein n=1 Tax=Aquimarina sp. RZ0 TaxID=2607730 RepID=UPI0011F31F46|nr:hypothetical protein [Aquimarina sp. RZ0]KAA1242592.1 hypothetical protein F0000_24910 [Aquimarina sp. RZ0]
MNLENDFKNLTESIDAQSKEMIKDFQDHLAEVKEVHPEVNDRMIFEGWAIQKIAGLQVIIKELAKDNQRLRNFSNLN